MNWGTDHEEKALKSFYAENVAKHIDFKTEKSGLFILQQKPFIAALPDGFMTCKCHGKSTLEIKCPFKIVQIIQNKRQNNLLNQIELSQLINHINIIHK